MLRVLALAFLLLTLACNKTPLKPPPPKTKAPPAHAAPPKTKAPPANAAPAKKQTALPYRTFADAAKALEHLLEKHAPLAQG